MVITTGVKRCQVELLKHNPIHNDGTMGLTKSKGNMYPWVTHTWNPIKGCGFACPYCYAENMAKRYGYDNTARLVEKELVTNLGHGRTIFVGSMGDMWGPWVSVDWIGRVINRCFDFPLNKYVFQSKNPKRFNEWFITPDPTFILGTTIETDKYPGGYSSNAPRINDRYNAMIKLPKGTVRFVTIEPIMDFNPPALLSLICNIKPDFVTIGADSKEHGLVEPTWDKVDFLIASLTHFKIEIRQKKNLDRLKK